MAGQEPSIAVKSGGRGGSRAPIPPAYPSDPANGPPSYFPYWHHGSGKRADPYSTDGAVNLVLADGHVELFSKNAGSGELVCWNFLTEQA